MAKYLIVGASSGIGKRLAEQLGEAGHQVYATYNKNIIHSEKSLIEFHHLNVLVEKINLDFLPDSINGIVYCPGSINLKPFEKIEPSEFLNSEQKKEANSQKHPLKKIGQPKDIADIAEFSLSEKAGWITGQIFHVDGGLSTLKI